MVILCCISRFRRYYTVADELSLLLINQEIHFITRLKAKASIKYLKIFSYDHSINLGLD